MSIDTILVPVSGEASDAAAIKTAIAAAGPFASHIALIAIHEDPALAVPLLGEPLAAETIGAIIEGQTEHGNAAAARARATLRDVCAPAGIAILETPARGAKVSCSFAQVWDNVAVGIGNAAALSDLVVLGPIRWDAQEAFNAAFLDVLREVRKPLLVAHPQPRPPRHVAIGWNGSAPAARAVAAAMPFLERAARTSVITVDCAGDGCADTQDLEDYLTRHGVGFGRHRAEAATAAAAGEALADAAAGLGADLLVAGAYGHDHLREALFGGATEALSARCAMPVLLAH